MPGSTPLVCPPTHLGQIRTQLLPNARVQGNFLGEAVLRDFLHLQDTLAEKSGHADPPTNPSPPTDFRPCPRHRKARLGDAWRPPSVAWGKPQPEPNPAGKPIGITNAARSQPQSLPGSHLVVSEPKLYVLRKGMHVNAVVVEEVVHARALGKVVLGVASQPAFLVLRGEKIVSARPC